MPSSFQMILLTIAKTTGQAMINKEATSPMKNFRVMSNFYIGRFRPPEDIAFLIKVTLHIRTCDKTGKQGSKHNGREHHGSAEKAIAFLKIDYSFFYRQNHYQSQTSQKVPFELANLLMDDPGCPHRYLLILTYL